jgi:2-iminoacetate synthase ThiH
LACTLEQYAQHPAKTKLVGMISFSELYMVSMALLNYTMYHTAATMAFDIANQENEHLVGSLDEIRNIQRSYLHRCKCEVI